MAFTALVGRVDRRPMFLTLAAALACAAAALITLATSPTPSISMLAWFNEPFLVGVALLAGGLAGWALRPGSRIGPLLCIAGVVSWVPYLQDSPVGPVASVAYGVREVWVPVLILVVLSYPDGRPTTFERVAAVLAFAQVLIPNLAAALLVRLPAPLQHRSFFAFANWPSVVSKINEVTARYSGKAMAGVIAALMLVRIVRGTRVTRAAAVPVAVGSGLTLLYFAFRDFTCGGILNWSDGADTLAHAAIPLAFLMALSRGHVARSRMAGLLIDIGEQPRGVALRDALARALGDPTLRLAYRLASEDRWVDPDGEPVELPSQGDGSASAVSLLERDGEPVAALIHDAALQHEPERLEPVRRAVRLLLDNERLTAEVRVQLGEVRASRKRILEAADAARARVQRDLHDGAQQRLVGLALNLRLAERLAAPETAILLAEAAREAEAALQELRELSRGLHPAVLTESGIHVAVEGAARRSPVPVTLDVTATGRYGEPVEATAYYVVTEALTNIAKYAQASAAQITIFDADGSLWVEVRDDGIGGAEIGAGSGLAGLRDRVEAIGGEFIVESAVGGGTRLAAHLPLDSAPRTPGHHEDGPAEQTSGVP